MLGARSKCGPRTTCSSSRQTVCVQASLFEGSGGSIKPVQVSAVAVSVAVIASLAVAPVMPAAAADDGSSTSSTVLEGPFKGYSDPQKRKLEAAEKSFESSDTLKALLEKSEANKAKNKQDILNKYCRRQAELGVGDCGGLRYIPGMTKNGKQPTPEWLQQVLGVEVPKVEGEGMTIDQLLGPEQP